MSSKTAEIRQLLLLIEEEDWSMLKSNFESIAIDSHIPSPRRILNPQCITIGKGFQTLSNTRIEAITGYSIQVFQPKIIIGNDVCFNSDCHIGCIDKITIGDNVLIASRVYITDHNHGFIDERDINIAPAKRSLTSKGPVVIENNVWIGEGVSVLSGVTIGANSIIGANSVVTKSFPENSVIAGIPAKLIRTLNQN